MTEVYDNPAFQSDAACDQNNHAEIRVTHDVGTNTPTRELSDKTSLPTKTEANGTKDRGEVPPEDVSKWRKGRSLLYRRRGLLFATGAALFFSAENMFMDVLASTLSIFEVSAIMSSMEFVLTLSCALVTKRNFPNTRWQFFSLLMSGLSLAAGLPLSLESLKHIEVGDSITIIYTLPIFAGLFSWIILREPLRALDFLFALLSFSGVVLIARPPFIFGSDSAVGPTPAGDENPLLGAVYALGGAVSFAMLVVIARKQSVMGLHPIIILTFNVLVVLVVNATICTILGHWTLPDAAEWGYLVGLACSDIVAQTLIYAAVVVEVAMFVSIVSTSEVIFTFLWQFLFFAVAPDWISAVGATLILAACIGLATKRERPLDGEGEVEVAGSGGTGIEANGVSMQLQHSGKTDEDKSRIIRTVSATVNDT